MIGEADDPVVLDLLRDGLARLDLFRSTMHEVAALEGPSTDLLAAASRRVQRLRLGAEESRSRLLARGQQLRAQDLLAGLVQVDACEEVVRHELAWYDVLDGVLEALGALVDAAAPDPTARHEVDAYLRRTLDSMGGWSTP